MALTVNTNVGAMAALQTLNQTSRDMSTTQSRINTGFNVASTKDDSAKFTIAQKLRGDVMGFQAVTSSLNNAKSITDVAVSGTEQISDLLNQMRTKAVEAADKSQTTESRDAITKDINAIKKQIASVINSSEFNGVNLLKGNGTVTAATATTPAEYDSPAAAPLDANVTAIKSLNDGDSSTDGYQVDSIGISNQGLNKLLFQAAGSATIAGGLGDEASAITITDAEDAEQLVQDINASFKLVQTSLSTLGSASRQIDSQLKFTSKLNDVLEAGIGNLVDADLAKESAKLQALQVKQQLGVQALSIANQAPQALMSLFR